MLTRSGRESKDSAVSFSHLCVLSDLEARLGVHVLFSVLCRGQIHIVFYYHHDRYHEITRPPGSFYDSLPDTTCLSGHELHEFVRRVTLSEMQTVAICRSREVLSGHKWFGHMQKLSEYYFDEERYRAQHWMVLKSLQGFIDNDSSPYTLERARRSLEVFFRSYDQDISLAIEKVLVMKTPEPSQVKSAQKANKFLRGFF